MTAQGALAFGACAALGGALGTPLGGLFIDWAARTSLASAHAAGVVAPRHARMVETRALVGAITLLIAAAALFMVRRLLIAADCF